MNAPLRSIAPDGAVGLTGYRPFIDGLRAVSILAVVLYHVGVPGVSGGYVGVDVFFVISGFLIITQITEAMDAGRFRFGDFWARRALRILPPYLLVLAFAIAVAPFILVLPEEVHDFGRQATYSAGMVVNHLFLDQQGYFDAPADVKPLLHLWSLSVEEQFYLAAPLLLATLYVLIRRSKLAHARDRYLGWSAAIVFLVSLAACILLTRAAGGRNPAFYVAPLRAWEFVAGSALALLLPWALRTLNRAQLSVMAVGGLSAIVASAIFYTPGMLYPSAFALLPVLGAAAVILAGLANPRAPAVRLLSLRPMVYLGLISYAWYLWHWPLLAFTRIMHFGERLLWLDALAGLASLGLAVLTYHLLEKPIRDWRRRGTLKTNWRPVIAGVAVCACFAIGGRIAANIVAEARAAEAIPAKYKPDPGPRNVYCDLKHVKTAAGCLKLTVGRPIGLLMGDSQAQTALNRLAGFASDHGSVIVSHASAGCVAIRGVRVFMPDDVMEADCIAVKETGTRVLAEGLRPDYAILYSRWPLYATGAPDYALGPDPGEQAAEDQEAMFVEGLRRTIADLQALGARRVLVVGPTPLFSRPAPRCLYLVDKYGVAGSQTCGVSRADHEALGKEAVRRIGLALAGIDGVRYLDPIEVFCDATVCVPGDGDQVLFIDTNHLSYAGTDRLISRHLADFEWVTGSGSGD